MGFRVNTFCKVWKVEDGKGNYKNVRLSVSKKNKMSGEYEQDFSGICMFIGPAKEKIEKVKEGDRIKITDIDVSNKYDKEKNTTYVTYKVFDFESDQSAPAQKTESVAKSEGENNSEDNLPF